MDNSILGYYFDITIQLYQDFSTDTWVTTFSFNAKQIDDKYKPVIPLSVVRPNQINEPSIPFFVNLKNKSISCIINSSHSFKDTETIWITGIILL